MSPAFTTLGLVSTEMMPQPFFYYNDLHVVMPVKRNLCEVQRDGAQIGIVWKLEADVFFGFMEVFIGKCVHGCV